MCSLSFLFRKIAILVAMGGCHGDVLARLIPSGKPDYIAMEHQHSNYHSKRPQTVWGGGQKDTAILVMMMMMMMMMM